MRIVLDTNVLVSGLLNASGNPGRVLDGLLLGEYCDVLARPKFRFDAIQRERLIDYIQSAGERIVTPPLAIELPDPGDLPFLEVAAHAAVDALVTGNGRHFPPRKRSGVIILTPAELIARWTEERKVE